MSCALVHMGIGTILSFSGVTLPQLLDPIEENIDLKNLTSNEFSFDNASKIIPYETPQNSTDIKIHHGQPLLTNDEAAFFSKYKEYLFLEKCNSLLTFY